MWSLSTHCTSPTACRRNQLDLDPFLEDHDQDGLVEAQCSDSLKVLNRLKEEDDLAKPKIYASVMPKERISPDSETLLRLDSVAWDSIRRSEDPVLLLTRILASNSGADQETYATGKKTKRNAEQLYQSLKQLPGESVVHCRDRFESIRPDCRAIRDSPWARRWCSGEGISDLIFLIRVVISSSLLILLSFATFLIVSISGDRSAGFFSLQLIRESRSHSFLLLLPLISVALLSLSSLLLRGLFVRLGGEYCV